VKGSVIPIVDFTTDCEGWMVFVLVGALIMFLCFSGFFFCRSMVWLLVWLCALSCSMLLYVVCSLCPCAVVYIAVQRRVCVWVHDIDCLYVFLLIHQPEDGHKRRSM